MLTQSRRLAHDPDLRLCRLIDELTNRLVAEPGIEIESLLARYPEDADRLRPLMPAMQAMAAVGASSGVSKASGTSRHARPGASSTMEIERGALGDFQLIREVGRGGMGIVYEAEQVSLGRRVALKVLPFAAVLDDRQLARFKNEARAAATLHHTNIVPVFSVGCEQGVHFYAMQFIEGQTLAQLIHQMRAEPVGNGLCAVPERHGGRSLQLPSETERLNAEPTLRDAPPQSSTLPPCDTPAYYRAVARLGIQAAEALEHAHQHGVIHRDIKPANLMLDGTGNLWVTDFGLARLESDAGMTMTGDLLGTLRYMSPEQTTGKPVAVDQRTDVYSLGATLYELLATQPAFAAEDRGALVRQIVEIEPLSLRHWRKSVPLELETIVLKSLSKEPGERYETAGELAADLRRYLDDKPIVARRPTLLVRARKWSQRHRGIVASAFMALVVCVVALAASTLLILDAYRKESQERTKAEGESERAGSNLALAQQVVDDMYTQFASKWIADQPGLKPVQEEFLRKAAVFYQQIASRQSDDPAVTLQTALSYGRLGAIQMALGDLKRGVESNRECVARLRTLVEQHPSETRYRDELLAAQGAYASSLFTTGDLSAAHELYRQEIASREADPELTRSADQKLQLVQALAQLASIEVQQDARENAQASAERALKLSPDVGRGSAQWDKACRIRAQSFSALAGVAFKNRDFETMRRHSASAVAILAEPMKAPSVTPHLRLQAAYAYSGMGRALNFSGQRTEAREALRTAVDIRRKLVAEFPDAPGLSQDLAWELRSLAASHLDQKQTEQADPLLKEAESLLSEVVRRKPDFERLTDYRRTLGQTRYLMGRLHLLDSDWDEAEREFRRGVEVYEGLVRDFPANVTHKSELAKFYWFLAISLNTQGRVEEAESIYRKCYDLCVAAGKGGDPRLLGEACLVLTEIHLFKIPADEKKRDYGRARGFAEEAVKHNRTNPVGFRAKSACYLGIAEYRLGNYPQAIESLNQARSLGHTEAVYFLAMAHWRLGDRDRATAYYTTALKEAIPTKKDSASEYRREAEALMGLDATSFISRGPRPPEP